MRGVRVLAKITSIVSAGKRLLANTVDTSQWTLVQNDDVEQPNEKKASTRSKNLKILLICVFLVVLCLIAWIYFSQVPEETFPKVPLYDSVQVQQFRATFPPQNSTLATSSLTYMLNKCIAGFGSYFNNALNLFLLALENNLLFHLQSLDWCYVSWSTFFYDYSSHYPAPIVLDRYSSDSKRWHQAEGKMNDITEPDFKGHIFVEHWGENFGDFYYNYSRRIKEPVFERKQVVAQALWEPKPLIMNVVNDIRAQYVEAPGKVFLSMHIRRGDKLKSEMENIPTSKYADKVLNIVSTQYPNRNIALFVFTDDDNAMVELRSLLADHLNIDIFGLTDAFNLLPHLGKSWSPLQQRLGYDQSDFGEASAKYQFQQTAELITDITLAAMADEFICTYSSNIARLISLLRTKSSDTVHSLDREAWSND